MTRSDNKGAIFIIGILFFVFGFISWLNAILIPYFKIICSLSVSQSMLVAFAFYISYFIMALPSSYILKRTGYRNGIALGLAVMAAGSLVFIPAAISGIYAIFLTGLFIQACGLTLLQTAANPYVTVLGPVKTATRRMSIMGVCNKVAGALAPLILLSVVMNSPDEIDQLQQQLPLMPAHEISKTLGELSGRLIMPYTIIALALAGLCLMIRFSNLPEIQHQQTPATEEKNNKKFIPPFPHLWLAAIALFCAVGVEVLVVDSIINYATFAGYSFRDAKYFASIVLVVMIVSYLLAIIIIPRLLEQRKALVLSAFTGILFTLPVVFTDGIISVWFLALLGFTNALLWPCIWPLALNGLGNYTSKGSALLVMAVVGGAIIPLVYGFASDIADPGLAYLLMVPLYGFILYFSITGYKAGKKLGISGKGTSSQTNFNLKVQ